MEIIRHYTTKNDSYRLYSALNVKGLMLHSTATPGIMAKAFRERFNKANLGKSVHGFIDDQFFVMTLPFTIKAGHCRFSGNNTHIGIELCEPKNYTGDGAYFSKVYKNALSVLLLLAKRFSLTAEDVLSHQEGYQKGIASNHSDVGHWFPYFGRSMDDVRRDLGALLMEEVLSVKALQTALNGAYGCGLAADGVFGPKTAAALTAHPLRNRAVKKEKNGAVRLLQAALNRRGISAGPEDGVYGKLTAAAVTGFQEVMGLAPDGVAGVRTFEALVN